MGDETKYGVRPADLPGGGKTAEDQPDQPLKDQEDQVADAFDKVGGSGYESEDN